MSSVTSAITASRLPELRAAVKRSMSSRTGSSVCMPPSSQPLPGAGRGLSVDRSRGAVIARRGLTGARCVEGRTAGVCREAFRRIPDAAGRSPEECSWAAWLFSESGLQLVNLADVLSELGVGGALADAGQRPADAFGAVWDDAGGDQGVEDLNVPGVEPCHHRGEVAARGCAVQRADRHRDDGMLALQGLRGERE